MKKIHGLLSVAGLLMMAASVSAGWGSSGGGFGSGGGYSAGYGSSGGYSAGYGSSGGGYSAGGGSSGGYTAGYGSSGGASAGYGSSGGVAHVGPLRRLAAHIHAHHANKVALRASAGSSGGGSSGGGSSGGYHRVSHGSSGGGYSPVSYGSYGSSGGSHHGSSGGGLSYSGGSSGGYSHASYGSAGSSYSSGAIYDSGVNYSESAPMYSSPSTYAAPTIEGTVPQPAPLHSGALDGSGWSNRLIASSKPAVDADQIQLNVVLPESATVFVNGNRTKSTGAVRRFVSKDLEAGQSYRFEVRAEREVNGRTVTEQKTIVLVPGSSESIEFALEEKSKAAETVLTLNVPQDAKVVLAGNGTKSVGETRTFRSNELAPGQVWDDYKIIVTWNGQVKEKTIRLIGGDELQVSFNFEGANKIAMR